MTERHYSPVLEGQEFNKENDMATAAKTTSDIDKPPPAEDPPADPKVESVAGIVMHHLAGLSDAQYAEVEKRVRKALGKA